MVIITERNSVTKLYYSQDSHDVKQIIFYIYDSSKYLNPSKSTKCFNFIETTSNTFRTLSEKIILKCGEIKLIN